MKRFFSLLCALLLVLSLAACSGKESPSSQKESSPSPSASEDEPKKSAKEPSSQSQTEQPQTDPPEKSPSMHEESFLIAGNNAQATEVVISVPESWRAASLEKLVSDNGCEVRFEGVHKAPSDRDAYLRGQEAELGGIIASGSLEDQGIDGRYYHFLLEPDDGTKVARVEYFVFHNGYVAAILLTPVSGADIDSQRGEFEAFLPTLRLGGSASQENTPTQTAGNAVIETIPQEEQLSYFRKYIEPYYIVGLMYSTWSDPEEIEVGLYMRFFIYTESDNYWGDQGQDPADVGGSVPAKIVEEYITSCFEVDPAYLRTAENYDKGTNCYLSMWTGGIGGGPGVIIDRIEKDGDLWKFVCRDESGNQLSVTIRILDEDTFHYIAGEGPSL